MASSGRSSESTIGSSDDLLLQILFFLPVISLMRFKVVNKQWCSLITSPSFQRHHFLHNADVQVHDTFILELFESQFFVCGPKFMRLIPLPFRFPSAAKIIQSSNGLLLLRCRNASLERDDYYVFNPVTLQSRDLLLTATVSHGPKLVFYAEHSPHYSVLCYSSEWSECRVYHSDAHEWEPEPQSTDFYNTYRRYIGAIPFLRPPYTYAPFQVSSHRPSSPSLKNYEAAVGNPKCAAQLRLTPDENRLILFDFSTDFELDYSPSDFKSNINQLVAANGSEIDLIGLISGAHNRDSVLFLRVPGKILCCMCSYGFFGLFGVVVDFAMENHFKEDDLDSGFNDAHTFIPTLAPV